MEDMDLVQTEPQEIVRQEHKEQFLGLNTLQEVEQYADFVRGVRKHFIRVLSPKDFVKLGKQMYLTEAGAQKCGQLVGVSITKQSSDKVQYTDERGPVIDFVHTVTASHHGRSVTCTGAASTKDAFFNGTEIDEATGEKRVARKPLELLSIANVMKKAETNACGRAIRKLLALEFTEEEVQEVFRATGQRGDVQSVSYNTGERQAVKKATGKGEMSPVKEELRDRLIKMADQGGDAKEHANNARKLLKAYSCFKNKDGEEVYAKAVLDMSDKWASSVLEKTENDWQQYLREGEADA